MQNVYRDVDIILLSKRIKQTHTTFCHLENKIIFR